MIVLFIAADATKRRCFLRVQAWWASVMALLSCACVPELAGTAFELGDLQPPAILDWEASGATELVIRFDEAVSAEPADFACTDGAASTGVCVTGGGCTLALSLPAPREAGSTFSVSGLARDASGNATSFVLPFWGYNDNPARLLLNEIVSAGSSTHPDAVELYAVRGGQLAGLAFFVGIRGDYDRRYIFPSCTVADGDYVVLHLKPQGLPEELDETINASVSGGLDATPGAWDFWYGGEDGSLPDKNGVLSVYASPLGELMDAMAYSERTSASDERYAGFGTAAFKRRVEALVGMGAWLASGEFAVPEDCAGSVYTTATRTMCRDSRSSDGDAKEDWHIVPTGGISVGGANGDSVYEP